MRAHYNEPDHDLISDFGRCVNYWYELWINHNTVRVLRAANPYVAWVEMKKMILFSEHKNDVAMCRVLPDYVMKHSDYYKDWIIMSDYWGIHFDENAVAFDGENIVMK